MDPWSFIVLTPWRLLNRGKKTRNIFISAVKTHVKILIRSRPPIFWCYKKWGLMKTLKLSWHTLIDTEGVKSYESLLGSGNGLVVSAVAQFQRRQGFNSYRLHFFMIICPYKVSGVMVLVKWFTKSPSYQQVLRSVPSTSKLLKAASFQIFSLC